MKNFRALRRRAIMGSPKSNEGGRVYNPKLIGIAQSVVCWHISPMKLKIKTYYMVKRLINKQ